MEDKAGKKEKIRYNVLLVPDTASATVKQISINLQIIKIGAAAVGVLVIAVLLYCVALTKALDKSKTDVMALQIQIDGIAKQKELLISQKVEQSKEIESLNNAINDREQLAKAYIPIGFPANGKASYDGSKVELEGNPIAMFHVAAGTSVTATANGMVSSVTMEAAGYVVKVVHGNGYVTVYRNAALPKVQEGANVTKETELFHIEAGKEDIGYQIMENEKYIDPLSLMEAYG